MQRFSSCAHLGNFGTGRPPRRFAPPLLIRGGEIRAGLAVPYHPGASRHPSSYEEGKFVPVSLSPTTPALRATPPHSRRGNSCRSRCPLPPRRFAPPLLIRGGEIRAGLAVPYHPGASRHPSSFEEGKFVPVSLSPTTPALRATPPHTRRGNSCRSRCPLPPRRFAPPLLIRGGEIRAGLAVPYHPGASRHPSSYEEGKFVPVSLSPTTPALRATPPHTRRGNSCRSRCPLPPRRFAPPLLIRGGEIRAGLAVPYHPGASRHPSSYEEGKFVPVSLSPTTPALRATPPHTRRGNSCRSRCPLPPRRFAPPLLIRGGEIRAGLAVPYHPGASRHPSSYEEGKFVPVSLSPTTPALRATPPHTRRGNSCRSRCPLPPRRFAPPLLIRGGEIRAGLAVPYHPGASRHPSSFEEG